MKQFIIKDKVTGEIITTDNKYHAELIAERRLDAHKTYFKTGKKEHQALNVEMVWENENTIIIKEKEESL